jgi:kynurenine 3-monooxygenase
MVSCKPWHEGDRVALVGDSAHAIVPFYGQGMNCGFEDCTVLDGLMGDGGVKDWSTMLAKYSSLRKPNGDAILELALRNFIEMRDLTGDAQFLQQKRIERKLAQQHPDRWVPLYSQVTFTHIDYAEALRRGDVQRAIMRQVMDRADIGEIWDNEELLNDVLQSALDLLDKK